jgi:hypothetical protein
MLSIAGKLNRLADFHAQREGMQADKQALIDTVLSPEAKARLAEIEAEFSTKGEAVEANISALEAEVRLRRCFWRRSNRPPANHLEQGQSWDDKGISAYAEKRLGCFSSRKQGEPSITIRRVGKETG